MPQPNYHPLEEGHFSHLVVHGERIELKIDCRTVDFNIQTAETLIDLLAGYVEDYRRRQMDNPPWRVPMEADNGS